MSRSVNTVASRKRKKKILNYTKGYWGARKNVYKVAKNAYEKALLYSYRDRRNKKRYFRKLWIQRINAFARIHNITYSVFINKLSKNEINIDRKNLANMIFNNEKSLDAIINTIKNN